MISPERRREIQKASDQRHRPYRTEYQRRYRLLHPEKNRSDYHNAWRKRNPQRWKAYCDAYYRRIRQQAFNGKACAGCGYNKNVVGLGIDHILPLSQGGTNDRQNLQILCGTCHQIKSASERGRRPILGSVKIKKLTPIQLLKVLYDGKS